MLTLAEIDNSIVSKTCPRSYLKLHLELQAQEKTMLDLAKAIDTNMLPKKIKMAYDKLVRDFKRKTHVEIVLTARAVWKNEKKVWAGGVQYYTTVDGENLPKENFARPLWTTEIKLAPELKKMGVKLVNYTGTITVGDNWKW